MSTQETSAGNTEPATDAGSQTATSQETTGKTYTQQEVDNMMAGLKGSLSKKLLKPYEELGAIDELRELKSQAEAVRQEQAMKRGEFEKILQEQAAKKDAEIVKRDRVIQEYRVDTPLLTTASEMRSVNPAQVTALLKNQVRLNSEGEVEVVDSQGQVRYSDSGQPLGVTDLVREFLAANPHFVAAGPATTATRSSIDAQNRDKKDLSKLDLRNPEHRRQAKAILSSR
jgi:hypothetical protein